MPREPQRATGNLAYLQIRLPGWLKNQIIDHCSSTQTSLNAWLVQAVHTQLRENLQIPQPPPAKTPLPTTADMIRNWATGERLLMPCGKNSPCAAVDDEGRWSHDGMGFCLECGIRVT